MKVRTDPTNKPYYKCLTCPRFRKLCGGMPTRDMTLQEWCDYICDVMYYYHLTNAAVAQAADVSITTMEKISAGNCKQDFMRGTTRRVEQIVLGPIGDHICFRDGTDKTSTSRITELEAELAEAKKELVRERNAHDRLAKIIDTYMK